MFFISVIYNKKKDEHDQIMKATFVDKTHFLVS